MQRAHEMRSQARLFRELAKSFDRPDLRQQIMALADQCDALATSIEESVVKKE